MPGFTPDEGREYLGNVLYTGGTQEDLTMGLFTNIPGGLVVTSDWSTVTQPSGSGYAEITLVQGTFVISATGVVTYPVQSWLAGDNWSPGGIYGYYIRNNNASPVLVHVEYRQDGIFQMTNGRTYFVDLSVDTS